MRPWPVNRIAVAAAIEEHYRPTRSGGALPETLLGALLGIADKMDSICGCFSVGTGSHRCRRSLCV